MNPQVQKLVEDYTLQCAAHEMNDADLAAAYVNRHLSNSTVTATQVQPILAASRQQHWDHVFHRPSSTPIVGIQFDDDNEVAIPLTPSSPPPRPWWRRLFGS